MSKTSTKIAKVIAISEELRKKQLAFTGYSTAAQTCEDPVTIIEGRSKLYQALEAFKQEHQIDGWKTQITTGNDFIFIINGVDYVSTGHKVLAYWKTSYHYDGEESFATWPVLDVTPHFITFLDSQRVTKARYQLGSYFHFSGGLGSIKLPETYEELAEMLGCTSEHEALQILQKVI